MAKKKNGFVVLLTSPVTDTSFAVKTGKGKFMSKSIAEKTLKGVLPRYPKKIFKTRVKKASLFDRLINPR